MLSKPTLSATLVGFIFLFFSGWIFHEYLAKDFFSPHYVNMPSMMSNEINYIALGVMIEAYLLSVIYGKWAKGRFTLSSGFKLGALLGLFVGLGLNMVSLGTIELMDAKGTLVEAVWNVVYFGTAGCLNGWIYKALS